MDSLDVVQLTRSLVDIDSTTGREGEVGQWLAHHLRQTGYLVTEQPVDAHRFNIIATITPAVTPTVVFSTHVDCVPPYFPSRLEGERLYGRGACDAKGILSAQVAAAEYAKTIAAQMMKTIRMVRLAATFIALVAMTISFSHQAHYLAALGMTSYAAWLIPGAIDALTFICVRVLATQAVETKGRSTAGWMLSFPVIVSGVINFVAPGEVLVKIAYVIAVLLIPAAEVVASRLRPDRRSPPAPAGSSASSPPPPSSVVPPASAGRTPV